MSGLDWINIARPSRRRLRRLLRMRSFIDAIDNQRHAEERPGASRGASRSTQIPAAAPSRKGQVASALVVILIALVIAGCGKKGNPQPQPGVPDTYPRTYPSE